MKKKILIPGRKKLPKKGTTPIKRVTEVDKVPLSKVLEEAQFDRTRMAFLVNVIFSLSDIVNGLAIDAESELKKVNPGLRLELRHPIERIKVHASEMVRFVDDKTSESFSEGFGEASDEVRELMQITTFPVTLTVWKIFSVGRNGNQIRYLRSCRLWISP